MIASTEKIDWYREAKDSARSRFASSPWPSATDEEWRRSDVSKLGLDAFIGASGTASVAFSADLSAAAGARLGPASLASLPALREAMAGIGDGGDRFAAWNLAEGEAWILELPAGSSSAAPILVECRLSGRASHPRLSVVAGEGAAAEIVYRVVAGDDIGLANVSLDLFLGADSSLRVFESHESGDDVLWFVDTKARVARDARLLHLVAETSGRFVKSRVDCALEGPGADAVLDGIFHASAGRHLDLRTVQRHLSPRATSRSLYKGALDSGGSSVCQGLIEVAKDASGTDAFLANRNLLLGNGARADSIPTLRIGNNDVRCSHGSTTGRLSEAEIFYLESRGFDRASARELLVLGFFNELFDAAPRVFSDPLIDRLSRLLVGSSNSGASREWAA